MNKVEWLMRGWYIDDEINDLIKEQRQAFELSVKTTTSFSIDGGKKAVANSSENKFTHYISYSKKIDNRIDDLYAVKNEIVTAINKVSDTRCRTILFKRFIQHKKVEEIAEETHYSAKQVARIIKKGVLECPVNSVLQ